jgi:thiosulfate/3-mercaptopyruvate sulfurtransferase
MSVIPVAQRGYTKPQLLAETNWLAEHLDDSNVRIVDARPPQQFSAGHIPGAVNLSGFGGIPRAADGDMADPKDFARVAGSLGIGNDATVVVYDAPSQMMGMVAWAFLYYGHQGVRLLDGGFEKWTREGRPVSTEAASYPQTIFSAKPVEAIYCSLSQAKSSHGRPQKVFWDTRSQAEYQGTAAAGGEPPPRLGRIPGAIHLEWTELLDPASKTLKPAAELRALLESRGITPDCEIRTY